MNRRQFGMTLTAALAGAFPMFAFAAPKTTISPKEVETYLAQIVFNKCFDPVEDVAEELVLLINDFEHNGFIHNSYCWSKQDEQNHLLTFRVAYNDKPIDTQAHVITLVVSRFGLSTSHEVKPTKVVS